MQRWKFAPVKNANRGKFRGRNKHALSTGAGGFRYFTLNGNNYESPANNDTLVIVEAAGTAEALSHFPK